MAEPSRKGASPALSIVVLCYDMVREVPRTVLSMSPDYQGVQADRYEIELVEMPSPSVLGEAEKAGFPANLRHTLESDNLPLTVAVNRAVARTSAPHVLICVDGARILSAGVVRYCLEAIRINPRATVAFHGLHLGLRPQQVAVPDGTHSTAIEDRLLDGIEFPRYPNRLFSIATWAESSRDGWFGPMAESCAIMLSRSRFDELSGFDERVTTPGGGLANSDFFARATAEPSSPLIVVLGEGTFHQFHGGSTTTSHAGRYRELAATFEEQTGQPIAPMPQRVVRYLGSLPPPALPLAMRSMVRVGRRRAAAGPASGRPSLERAQARAFARTERTDRPIRLALVIGMHRSGTSYLARQLVRGGGTVPGEALGGAPASNPDGHFEPVGVVAWHNAVLSDLGHTWCTIAAPDPNALGAEWREWRVRGLARMLRDLCADDDALWVVKDPRMCLFLPLWRDALALLDADVAMLRVMRHPAAVADSLHRRDAIGRDVARLVWARHVHAMLDGVTDGDELACLDAMATSELEAFVGGRLGERVSFEPLSQTMPRDADDPVSALYEAFVASRNVDALRAGLAAELAFTERYPTLTRIVDPVTAIV